MVGDGSWWADENITPTKDGSAAEITEGHANVGQLMTLAVNPMSVFMGPLTIIISSTLICQPSQLPDPLALMDWLTATQTPTILVQPTRLLENKPCLEMGWLAGSPYSSWLETVSILEQVDYPSRHSPTGYGWHPWMGGVIWVRTKSILISCTAVYGWYIINQTLIVTHPHPSAAKFLPLMKTWN